MFGIEAKKMDGMELELEEIMNIAGQVAGQMRRKVCLGHS
jgi:hypothetical protein